MDLGPGLLGLSSAAATLDEMDQAVSGIKSWKARHEREMVGLGGCVRHA